MFLYGVDNIDKHIQTKRIGSLATALCHGVAGSIPVSAWSAPSVFFYGVVSLVVKHLAYT